MRERVLSDLAAVVRGELRGDDVRVTSVVVDSREAVQGSLFVAMRGARSDGHRFVHDAFRRGARAALVREAGGIRGSLVRVTDTGRALLALAADERAGLSTTVVGVTGSAGKTTTKDFTAAVLSSRFQVHASPASFNNEIGVPLTVLGAPPETEALVCEIGAGAVWEIARLCRVARPVVGVVTNVGLAHVATFGSPQRIAQAKAELVGSLPADGLAVLNADDPVVRAFASRTRARVVTYGASGRADVRAEQVVLDPVGRAAFTLVANGGQERVTLPLPGEHMVSNALAASACGISLGVSPAECAAALRSATVSPWRMELFTTPARLRVLNDAYNANPASMAAALRAARAASNGGRCIAVLGCMAELGDASLGEHERVGRLAADLGIDRLITVGEEARAIASAAIARGMRSEDVVAVDEPEDSIGAVLEAVHPGDLVLLKGSRVAGLESVAEALRTSPL